MNYEYTKAEKEFLEALETKQIKSIYFVDAIMLVNPSSGDFDKIVIEFDDCNYIIKQVDFENPDENNLFAFAIEKVCDKINGIEEEYKIFSTDENQIEFVRPLIDEYKNFSILEFKHKNYYVFIFAGEYEVVTTFSYNEEMIELFAPDMNKAKLDLNDNEDYIYFFDA